MSQLEELVKKGKYQEAIELPADRLGAKDAFLRVSAFLSLGKGKEALEYLLSERERLFKADPLMCIRVNFELRFLLKEFDLAEEDLDFFQNQPYVSQRVEEALRDLPKAILAARASQKSAKGMDFEEAMETLASPSDDFALLAALGALRKQGELEDYRGLVEEILASFHHDDVKTYALMLLSAKGSTHKVTLTKGGKSFRLVPAKIGSPFGMAEYKVLRERIEKVGDSSLTQVMGELLDLYALIRYPERFVTAGDLDSFFEGLEGLGRTYLGQEEGNLSEKAHRWCLEIKEAIAKNPPLME